MLVASNIGLHLILSIFIGRHKRYRCGNFLYPENEKMKKNILIVFSLTLTQFLTGQSFQEICESESTNGVMVDCQFFNDTLYATGFFNTICGESVGYVAKWENDEWQPTAINLSDPGHALKEIGNKLYIAKYEESIDSNWVYFYDNSMLNKLGKGVYLTTASGFSELPNIYDIIEFDGKIVACGEFDKVGEELIQGIMQWDGNSWEALGTGINENIQGTAPVMFPHQMMVYNSELYVVGNFRNAGGLEVNGIAKWNGMEWMNMGAGFNNTVYSVVVYNDEIVVGGSFTESGGTTLNRIAKWDGSNWVAMDFGFSQPTSNDFIFVHTLKVIDDILYIGGGLKEIIYPDNSTEICNGIISYSDNGLNTFMGGVPGNDIEAICKTDTYQILIGGGVFGSGYSGITEINTNTKESKLPSEISIAPNPFNQSITIKTKITFEKYIITNEFGQVIKQGKFENRIQLNSPDGIYFLKLIDENKLYSSHKIIKMKS